MNKETEAKWQAKWKEWKTASFDKKNAGKKFYVLEMFSYPSGANLHIGHVYNFAPSDTYARFKKMQGFEVFQPMGFDAFGLPAENYAIQTGIHPQDSTLKNVGIMRRQLVEIGAMYDWDHEVITCSPEYYRWTQWLFIQLFKRGLAYQKQAPVNWCTSCNTVIANEQVEDGRCERCKAEVVRKNMTQWFFKITDYAEELLRDLDGLDWPEKTKAMQRNWIGKSTGGEIVFPLNFDETNGPGISPFSSGDALSKRMPDCINKGCPDSGSQDCITVFTTRADTLFGVSYVVLAPEHPLVDKITTVEYREAVEKYKYEASKISEIERLSDKGGKTGVFTGGYCIHPLTGRLLPVWIADYCLATYGTGAVMGVPAHDTRDFEFATKYGLSIKRVVAAPGNGSGNEGNIGGTGETNGLPYIAYGILTGSGAFDGLDSETAKMKIVNELGKKNLGSAKTNYRLRDWSVSRQRYWGCPIPIIHCPRCGAVPVPEDQLPVTLPYNVNFKPGGKSPLCADEEYINTICPVCGKPAKRDADTLDTFVDSAWYFLRYPDNKNTDQAFDKKLIDKMLPVDKYIGGPEHACMHLLYSRFFTKALRDMGYLSFSEPFKSLVHQGMILGEDGEKMSKSKGNTINPDEYIREYGSDVFRMYLMFGFSYVEGGPWNGDGIKAVSRFLDRAERIVDTALAGVSEGGGSDGEGAKSEEKKSRQSKEGSLTAADKDLIYALHYCIKNVTADLEAFSFNTAIARLMELVNTMYKYAAAQAKPYLLYDAAFTLIRLIAPFAPHFAEELNERAGGKASIFTSAYPICDESKLRKNEIEIAVQINSKIVGRIMINTDWTDAQVTSAAVSNDKISSLLKDKTVIKAIVIKERLINLIIAGSDKA